MSDFDVDSYRDILTDHLVACENTVSTEILRARMWQFCLTAAINLYTTAGVLERIAKVIAIPETPEEEETEESED